MFLLKKRYWLLIALLLTVFLVLRTAPASWVIYAIQQAAPGFKVSGVSGALWQGKAEYSEWADQGRTLPLGEINWKLQALSLLTLNPCVGFSSKALQQSITGTACYALFGGSVQLSQLDASLPIANISPYFSVDLEGLVDLHLDELIWTAEQQLGETKGQLLWQRASLYNGSQWIALGDIQAQLTDNGSGGLEAQWNSVETDGKPTPVKFDIKTEIANLTQQPPSIRVNGTIKPASSRSGLEAMLQFVGEQTNDGGYRVDINE